MMTPVKYGPNTLIMIEGDPCEKMFLVRHGTVDVCIRLLEASFIPLVVQE